MSPAASRVIRQSVQLDGDDLPKDKEALRALIVAERARHTETIARIEGERAAALAERDHALGDNDRLRHMLRQLRHGQFGRRSEKLPKDQLQLALEDIETAIARNESQEAKQTRKPPRERSAGEARKSLPAHLPRIEVVIDPEDIACPCCRQDMQVIGEETSQRLDVIPAQFRVIVTRRRKFACRSCEASVVQAPAPERLIRGGLPTEALVAHVLAGKYAWHLPLYRQAQMLKSQGIEIDRSTLAFWVGYAAAELAPLQQRLRQILLASAAIFVDETTAPVLDPGRGRTKTGYFWTIARDDRPWGGRDPPAVVYTYAPGRAHEHGRRLLAGYGGIVHCDGYAAYKHLADPGREGGPATLAFCWSHWRRQFHKLAQTGPSPIAAEALERIQAIYAIEAEIRGHEPALRRARRQAETKALVQALRTWLEIQLGNVSAKAPIADAIRYGFNHWDGLVRFLEDGRIEVDTNAVERSMRPIALSRKNALFAGHDEGAANWASIASLVETAKLNGVDPQAYFADVLTKLVNLWPASRLDELMPWNWAAGTASHLRAAAH